MNELRLNLFCLVDGEPQSNVFSVKPTPADNVDNLKNLIKSALSPQFDDIAAKYLTLWSVSIPDDDDDDEIPIVLGNVNNKDKKKLRATHGLFGGLSRQAAQKHNSCHLSSSTSPFSSHDSPPWLPFG